MNEFAQIIDIRWKSNNFQLVRTCILRRQVWNTYDYMLCARRPDLDVAMLARRMLKTAYTDFFLFFSFFFFFFAHVLLWLFLVYG